MKLPPFVSNTAAEPASSARLFEQAAILGSFDPRALVNSSKSEEPRTDLRLLANYCDEVEMNDDLWWRLKPDPRREMLARLHAEKRLIMVAKEAKPMPADRFGQWLRAALIGEMKIPSPIDLLALDELRQALQFAAQQSQDAQQKLTDVEVSLARQEREGALRMLVPKKLLGRDEELSQLVDFLHAPPVALLNLMCVTGVGGAGKSALLAEFAFRVQQTDWTGSPVIILDFDRAALADTSEIDLIAELTRQLEIFWPALRDRFANFRAFLKDMELRIDTGVSSSLYEGKASAFSYLWSTWKSTFADLLPIKTPLLLILDTFEEVLSRGVGETNYILKWLVSLVTEGELPGVRVVISGRAVPNLDPLLRNSHTSVLRLNIGDLKHGAAKDLLEQDLRRMDVPNINQLRVSELIERFGGHPLLLKVLARFLHAQSAPQKAVDELLKISNRGANAFDREFSQTFLYQRILRRIRSEDPAIEALAHPGLALRRVTPHLIKRVLAKPCMIGELDATRARALFEQLRRQVWLVEHTERHDVVNHRRDLRRLMLHAMESDPLRQTRRIHRRAAGYYHFGLDPFLSIAEQRFESLYHALMSGTIRYMLTPEEARPFLLYLGEDADQLPLRSRAILKLDGGFSLTSEEVEVLDAGRREIHTYRMGTLSNLRGNYPAQATTFLTVANAFSAGAFEAVLEMAPLAIASFEKALKFAASSRERAPVDVTGEEIWQVAMAALALGDQVVFAQALYDKLDEIRIDWRQQFRRRGQWGASAGLVADMLAALLGESIPFRSTMLKQVETIRTVENLRAVALLTPFDIITSSPLRVRTDLLRNLEPIFVERSISKGTLSSNLKIDFMDNSLSDAETDFVRRAYTMGGRATLADFNFTRKNWVVRAKQWPSEEEDRRLLYGCLPELYPAIRGALQVLPESIVFDYAASKSGDGGWPFELMADALKVQFEHDKGRWLSTLIEFSDRRGELQALVEYCSETQSPPTSINAVRHLIQTYINRLVDPVSKRGNVVQQY